MYKDLQRYHHTSVISNWTGCAMLYTCTNSSTKSYYVIYVY